MGMSSEDGGHDTQRKGYRHKTRSGRTVRERRLGRRSRNSAMIAQSSRVQRGDDQEAFAWLARLKAVFRAELSQGTIYLHPMRFGLFCAMAWSMSSIILSVIRLYQSGSFPALLGADGNSSSFP